MGHVLGAEKEFFLIRGAEADDATGQVIRLIRECRGRCLPGGEGMFPGRYSGIFGLGGRLGCTLNVGHSIYAIEAYI